MIDNDMIIEQLYIEALEEVEDAESHQLQLNGHTLRMVGLHRDFSLDLP